MTYCKIDLTTRAILGGPGPLPSELVGLDDAALSDLSWVGYPLSETCAGIGFWPVIDMRVDSLPAEPLTVDPEASVVRRAVLVPQAPEPLPPAERPLSRLEFRALWTFEERVVLDSPSLAVGLTELQRGQLRTLMKDLDAASSIVLSHPDIIQGVRMVQSFGLIGGDRADCILAGLPPA